MVGEREKQAWKQQGEGRNGINTLHVKTEALIKVP